MKHRTVVACLTVLAALSIAPKLRALDAEAVEKTRLDFFKSMGKPAKALGEELKKPDAALAEIRRLAAEIDAAAPHLQEHFPAGSGPDKLAKTRVKAEIWAKPEEFRKDAEGLAQAAHDLVQVAQKDDVAAAKKAADTLFGACKTCHETFRGPEL